MSEFIITDRTYRTCRMNAFQQLHVARRLLPILAKIPDMLGLTLEDIMTDTKGVVDSLTSNLNSIRLEAIADAFAGLDQENVDYILNTCLDSTQIKDPNGTGWGQVRKNGVVMYGHVGLREMLEIAVNVIKDNLGDFFGENAPALLGAKTVTAMKE